MIIYDLVKKKLKAMLKNVNKISVKDGKLEPTSIKDIFLGYVVGVKGCRL